MHPSPTNRHLQDLLPKVLRKISSVHEERPDLILAAWPEVIGDKLSAMTEAVSYHEGTLTVRVKNSTLYSLLTQSERPKLLAKLKSRFPKSKIEKLYFRM